MKTKIQLITSTLLLVFSMLNTSAIAAVSVEQFLTLPNSYGHSDLVYKSNTTTPMTASENSVTTTSQFESTNNCIGNACKVNGPAVGTYLQGAAGGLYGVDGMSQILYDVTINGGSAVVPINFTGTYFNSNPDSPINTSGKTISVVTASIYSHYQDVTKVGTSDFYFLGYKPDFNFSSLCYNFPAGNEERAPEVNCGSGTAYGGTVNLPGGTTFKVYLAANILQLSKDIYANNVSAFIDPIISIDPTWAVSHPGYQLSFDSGVSNYTTTVPVPAAVWLFGSALMGFIGLKKRKD
jgi:hypothetical protein